MDNQNTITLSSLINDYVDYKLARAGFSPNRYSNKHINNYSINSVNTNSVVTTDREVLNTVVRVCSEFENRFNEQFLGVMEELCSDVDNFDREGYYVVLDNIIEGGINWGRVVALFAFVGKMAVMAGQHGLHNKVDLLVDWTVGYMEDNIKPWILSNGGLEGFMKFFTPQHKEPPQQKSQFGIMVAGFVGLAALGAFVVQHS